MKEIIQTTFGFVQSHGVNENDVLLFGTGIEEVVRHCGMSVLVGRLFVNPPKLIKPALMQQ